VKLRYKLALLNFFLVLLMGFITWPLSLNQFTFLKYIDPILLWDFQSFACGVDRVRELVHLPLNIETFAVLTTAIHYIFVIAIGTIQWLIIGAICERSSVIFKARRNSGTASPGSATKPL
jgi:hypothetical protein